MTSGAIPKTIHYCWFGGAPMSELGRQCLKTWRQTMPDYAIRTWDEAHFDRTSPYVDTAYRMRRFAFVADYVRLRALYDEGGVYLDTDMEVLRRFDELLDDSLFLGLQAPGSIGMGVIGAVKGHPFLKLILDALDAEAHAGKPLFRPLPDIASELLRQTGAAGVTVYPEDYFYPYNPYSPSPLRRKPLQSNLTERTFAIHHWEGTWLGALSVRELIAQRLKTAARRIIPTRRLRPPVLGERGT